MYFGLLFLCDGGSMPTRGRLFRRAIEALEEVLAITVVSKSVMPVRVPTGQILSNALCVFATDSFAIQAVLSSSFHFLWVVKYGSGMRNDPRYTSSDVFDTFPRPSDTPGLDRVGKNLDQLRREIMLRRRLGLTALYNLVNDPQRCNRTPMLIACGRSMSRSMRKY